MKAILRRRVKNAVITHKNNSNTQSDVFLYCLFGCLPQENSKTLLRKTCLSEKKK